MTANGTVIKELEGLLFTEDATVSSRNIAIAVNYSKALSEYAGGAYFWVGGKNRTFTIPSVKAGQTITMEVESHKTSDARGIEINGEAFTPTTKDSYTWTIAADGDVVVKNTNGCHIYKIEVK